MNGLFNAYFPRFNAYFPRLMLTFPVLMLTFPVFAGGTTAESPIAPPTMPALLLRQLNPSSATTDTWTAALGLTTGVYSMSFPATVMLTAKTEPMS